MQELSLHVMDLIQNSVRAGATQVVVTMEELTEEHLLTVTVRDNGCGMDVCLMDNALQEGFSTTPNGRGMGLPLMRQAAEKTGGWFSLESVEGLYTMVTAGFRTNHPQYVRIGAMSDTFALCMAGHPGLSLIYVRSCDGRTFTISTDAMRQVLGDAPASALSARPVLEWTVTTIEEQTARLDSQA